MLGFCYDNGHGVIEDMAEAVKYYRRAADAGHAGALFNLGLCYANGHGVAEDKAAAVDYYRRAADAEDADATCWGFATTTDTALSRTWRRR
jgi:uncharacterized protein